MSSSNVLTAESDVISYDSIYTFTYNASSIYKHLAKKGSSKELMAPGDDGAIVLHGGEGPIGAHDLLHIRKLRQNAAAVAATQGIASQ